MFKNTLFLKIILIFTLPALGILYFSSSLVYEKYVLNKELNSTDKNLEYLKIIEKVSSHLQEERMLSIKYMLSKNGYSQLEQKRVTTTNFFNEFNSLIKNYTFDKSFSHTVLDIKKLDELRIKIDTLQISFYEVFEEYNQLNKVLLDSPYLLSPVKNFTEFNISFLNNVNFLTFKESVEIEKALFIIYLNNKYLDEKLQDLFIRNNVIQEMTKTHFFTKINLDFTQKFSEDKSNKIILLRNNIKNKSGEYPKLKVEDWEKILAENLENISNTFESMINITERTAFKLRNELAIEKNKSLIFLFICFSTLISLLFVLRNIIFNEQKSFNKVQKHKEIYELLNQANKLLLKMNDKKRLYSNICELLSENNNIIFCFIYDLDEKNIVARDGEFKEKLITQMNNYQDKNQDNIVSRTIKWETNLIINNFEEKNVSVFYSDAKKLNIKSMASLPIKKFNLVVGTLVIYSNELNFFDHEVEILFDKLVNDMTHSLEKIDYEEIRLKQEDELRLASYAFESTEPMLITNNVGVIIKVNQAFCNTMGYPKEEIIGKNPRIFKSSHQNKNFGDELWNDLKVKGFWSGEVYNKKSNNQIVPLRSTITAIKDNEGRITHYLGQYIDIAEQKDKEKILEYQATHDNLTGLPNRLLLLDRIEHAITKVVRHKIVGGLIFIDLDNFKEVNDTLGHDIGDVLLITVAKKIKEVIRDEDTIARIGGDEFIVLIDNIGNNKENAKTNITTLAEKIKNTLNSITHIEGHVNVSTPSIGITLFSDASVSVKDIIKQADTAMYVAKKQGKNSIEFFD